MTIADLLAATYATLLEDSSPPLSRAQARGAVDEFLDAPLPDAETWGESAEEQARQDAMMGMVR